MTHVVDQAHLLPLTRVSIPDGKGEENKPVYIMHREHRGQGGATPPRSPQGHSPVTQDPPQRDSTLQGYTNSQWHCPGGRTLTHTPVGGIQHPITAAIILTTSTALFFYDIESFEDSSPSTFYKVPFILGLPDISSELASS